MDNDTLTFAKINQPNIQGGNISLSNITGTTISSSYISSCQANSLQIGSTSIEEAKIITNKKIINLNEVLTLDMISKEKGPDNIYKALFLSLCRNFPEEEGQMRALLRMYNNNYRYTVIAIENKHIKEELKRLNETFKDL